MKPSQPVELVLRAIGVFLSVYFTVGWGERAAVKYDVPILISAVFLALFLRYYD